MPIKNISSLIDFFENFDFGLSKFTIQGLKTLVINYKMHHLIKTLKKVGIIISMSVIVMEPFGTN